MAGSFFTVGKDGSLVIQHSLAGGEITLPLMTEFDAKPNPVTLKTVTIAGDHLEDFLPGNYSITITCDRGNSVLDDFQSALDLAKRRGARVPTGSIYQYVTELDGSTSTYAFDQVTFQVTDLGKYAGDQMVKQTLMASAVARRRM